VAAIRPFLVKWLNREFGEVNYYISQMMTGHGSFGHYLFRIDKRENAACFHCNSDDDSVEHTVAECPAWDIPRFEIMRKLGLGINDRLTLELIVGKILEKEYWTAFSHFAALVLRAKEEEERRRERASSLPSPIQGTSD